MILTPCSVLTRFSLARSWARGLTRWNDCRTKTNHRTDTHRWSVVNKQQRAAWESSLLDGQPCRQPSGLGKGAKLAVSYWAAISLRTTFLTSDIRLSLICVNEIMWPAGLGGGRVFINLQPSGCLARSSNMREMPTLRKGDILIYIIAKVSPHAAAKL